MPLRKDCFEVSVGRIVFVAWHGAQAYHWSNLFFGWRKWLRFFFFETRRLPIFITLPKNSVAPSKRPGNQKETHLDKKNQCFRCKLALSLPELYPYKSNLLMFEGEGNLKFHAEDVDSSSIL